MSAAPPETLPPPHTPDSRPNASALARLPLFILLVSLLQTAVYFAADDSMRGALLYDAGCRRELWRFLSYMLVHTDGVHLGLNVVIQGLVGTPVELEQGRVRCAVVYLGGGLAGSVGTGAVGGFSRMAGASGGVYALLMAQIPNVVLNYGTMRWAGQRLAAVVVLTGADVADVVFHVHFSESGRPKVGWVAHASGAAAGILLGFLVFEGTSKWRRKLRTASCALLALPLLFLLLSLTSSPNPTT